MRLAKPQTLDACYKRFENCGCFYCVRYNEEKQCVIYKQLVKNEEKRRKKNEK